MIQLVGRKSLLMLLARLFSALLSFIGYYYMWRYLGKDSYGSIAFSLAFLATINTIADLGFSTAHIKRISEGKDVNQCLSTFIAVRIVLIFAMVGTTLGLVLLWPVIFDKEILAGDLNVLLALLIYFVLYDIAGIATYTFDAKLQTAKSQLAFIVDPIIRIPIIIFVSINRMGPFEASLAYVAGGALTMLVAISLLAREGINIGRPVLFRSYFSYALPVALILVVSNLMTNADKIFLGTFWGNSEVALYNAGQTFLNILGMVGAVVATLILPLFSQLWNEGKKTDIINKTIMMERYSMFIALPISAVIILMPYDVARIVFGGTFRDAGSALQFQIIVSLLNMLNVAYIYQLYAADRPSIILKIYIIGTVVNVLLLTALVPEKVFGISMIGMSYTGAAIAMLITMGLVYFTTRIVAYRFVKVPFYIGFVKHGIAFGLSLLTLVVLSHFWTVGRWYDLAYYTLIAYGVYSLVTIIMKEIKDEDINFVSQIINIKELKKYIVDEFKK
ncbi:MAG: flippase [Methanomassiliicoccales archaeon]|nr:MAG: flippase [Methanomassiliicoccales archaeon]